MAIRYMILLMVYNITLPSISVFADSMYLLGGLASYNSCRYTLAHFVLCLCFYHIFEGQEYRAVIQY